jgi:uncharacterized secreted protein with C-terminal beta-propeller domain
MRKEERLINSIGSIDEKFIEEANGKMKKTKNKGGINPAWKAVASFVVIVGLALFLFLPVNPGPQNLSAYKDSEYYPLMEKLESYRADSTALPYDNNFELIGMVVKTLFTFTFMGGAMAPDAAPPMQEEGAMNGEYVETTDNQVSGVIEGDIIKTTTTHLFQYSHGNLMIFKLDGENTERTAIFDVQKVLGGKIYSETEMYLTVDGKTVIIVTDYTSADKRAKVGVIFIDVADPANPHCESVVSIDGSYNTSRLVGDKLLLMSEYYFSIKNVNYDDPSTYVPTVTRDGVDSLLTMDEIFAPSGVNASRYTVVASIDIGSREITGANGLLNFTNTVYVSENNVYVTRNYSETKETSGNAKINETMTDIAVLGYTEEGLDRRVVTVSGTVLNQYSMDELDGYLRVVTSTSKFDYVSGGMFSTPARSIRSASLYVVNLESCDTIASVENFAPEGEEVASVRFDGDTLYVCTAVVATFTDPVFFFDLSDYSNITYTDTGVIDGFSTSLINLGEGFLLGIGRVDWGTNKVEVYEEQAGRVVSVAEFVFDGDYSTNYKDYLVNREENLFGFAVFGDSKYKNEYILLQFDGYDLNVVTHVDHVYSNRTVRGILRGYYLYVVDDGGIVVVDLSVPYGAEGHEVKIVY